MKPMDFSKLRSFLEKLASTSKPTHLCVESLNGIGHALQLWDNQFLIAVPYTPDSGTESETNMVDLRKVGERLAPVCKVMIIPRMAFSTPPSPTKVVESKFPGRKSLDVLNAIESIPGLDEMSPFLRRQQEIELAGVFSAAGIMSAGRTAPTCTEASTEKNVMINASWNLAIRDAVNYIISPLGLRSSTQSNSTTLIFGCSYRPSIVIATLCIMDIMWRRVAKEGNTESLEEFAKTLQHPQEKADTPAAVYYSSLSDPMNIFSVMKKLLFPESGMPFKFESWGAMAFIALVTANMVTSAWDAQPEPKLRQPPPPSSTVMSPTALAVVSAAAAAAAAATATAVSTPKPPSDIREHEEEEEKKKKKKKQQPPKQKKRSRASSPVSSASSSSGSSNEDNEEEEEEEEAPPLPPVAEESGGEDPEDDDNNSGCSSPPPPPPPLPSSSYPSSPVVHPVPVTVVSAASSPSKRPDKRVRIDSDLRLDAPVPTLPVSGLPLSIRHACVLFLSQDSLELHSPAPAPGKLPSSVGVPVTLGDLGVSFNPVFASINTNLLTILLNATRMLDRAPPAPAGAVFHPALAAITATLQQMEAVVNDVAKLFSVDSPEAFLCASRSAQAAVAGLKPVVSSSEKKSNTPQGNKAVALLGEFKETFLDLGDTSDAPELHKRFEDAVDSKAFFAAVLAEANSFFDPKFVRMVERASAQLKDVSESLIEESPVFCNPHVVAKSTVQITPAIKTAVISAATEAAVFINECLAKVSPASMPGLWGLLEACVAARTKVSNGVVEAADGRAEAGSGSGSGSGSAPAPKPRKAPSATNGAGTAKSKQATLKAAPASKDILTAVMTVIDLVSSSLTETLKRSKLVIGIKRVLELNCKSFSEKDSLLVHLSGSIGAKTTCKVQVDLARKFIDARLTKPGEVDTTKLCENKAEPIDIFDAILGRVLMHLTKASFESLLAGVNFGAASTLTDTNLTPVTKYFLNIWKSGSSNELYPVVAAFLPKPSFTKTPASNVSLPSQDISFNNIGIAEFMAMLMFAYFTAFPIDAVGTVDTSLTPEQKIAIRFLISFIADGFKTTNATKDRPALFPFQYSTDAATVTAVKRLAKQLSLAIGDVALVPLEEKKRAAPKKKASKPTAGAGAGTGAGSVGSFITNRNQATEEVDSESE